MEDKPLLTILRNLMLQTVPAYANKFFYSLGFLAMTALLVLIASGMVMVFFGPNWWLTNSWGVYVRSVHLWAAQAFIFFVLLHLLIVFLTSGFKAPRQLTWVVGGLMFFLALAEAEFGYILRGDFSSQWRSLQAADLYNGSGLGIAINNLNYAQIYGIHIIFIPLIILGLLFLHYLLVRVRGIAKPYKAEVPIKMVPADHTILFLRGTVLVLVIVILAKVFPSPMILPTTIADIAKIDPELIAKTLISERDHTSNTATYQDTIKPYQFDTKKIYVDDPYTKYRELTGQTAPDEITALVKMAKSGLYESSLPNTTYVTRFIVDAGVLDEKAEKLGMKTEQYGMIHEEKPGLPLGAWWLTPLGLMDNTILKNDPNQDRDGGEILGLSVLLLLAFPFIPFVNRLPEKLPFARWLWR